MSLLRKYIRLAVFGSVALTLALAGCGGGDNSNTANTVINTPISVTGTVISITGVVIKGPMSGAQITIADAKTGVAIKDQNGTPLPVITTAADGSWSINTKLATGVTGPFIVTAQGGNYLDEYSGVTVPFAGQSMQGVIPSSNVHQQNQIPVISDTVVITPMTHAIALQAQQTIADGYAAITVVDALIQDAYSTYQFNPVLTIPESSTTNANASPASQQYEALLGGISTILNQAGVDPYSMFMAQAAVSFAVDILKDGYALTTAPILNNVTGFTATNAISLLPIDAYGAKLSVAAQQYINTQNATLAVKTVTVAGTSKTAGTKPLTTPIAVGVVAITGTAMDGPLAGATVVITDAIGGIQATGTTAANGSYNLSVSQQAALPLEIIISGGIDTVTGLAPTFPVSTMVATPLTNITNLTANANTITSMIVTTAKARAVGGVVDTATLTQATKDVVAILGLGLDPAINPISTALSATNVAAIIKASQGLSELLTRTAIDTVVANHKANAAAGLATQVQATGDDIRAVMATLAADLADGKLDGIATTVALAGGVAAINTIATHSILPALPITIPSVAQTKAVFSLTQINTVQVGTELLTNQLAITTPSGNVLMPSATSAMNLAAAKAVGVATINTSNVPLAPAAAALQTQMNNAIAITNTLMAADIYSAATIPLIQRQNQLTTLNTAINNVINASTVNMNGALVQLQIDMANANNTLAVTRTDALQAAAVQLLQNIKPSSSPNVAKAKNALRTGNVAIAKADFAAANLANPKDIEAVLGLCASNLAEISTNPTLRSLVGKFTTDAGASLPLQATIAAELVGAATAPAPAPFNPYATTVWQQIKWARTGAQLATTAVNATLLQDPAFDIVHATLSRCIKMIVKVKASGFSSQSTQRAGRTTLWDIADINALLSISYGARGAMNWSRAYNWNTDANIDGVADTQIKTFIDGYGNSYQYSDISIDPVASLNDPMFFTLTTGSGVANLASALQDFYAAADLQTAFLSDMYGNIPRSQDVAHVFTYQNQPAQVWWIPFNPLALPNAIGNDLTNARDVAKSLSKSGLMVNNVTTSDGTITAGTVFGQNIFLSPFDRNTFPTFSYAIPPKLSLSKKYNKPVVAETGIFWNPVVQADIIAGKNYDPTLAGVLGTGLTLDVVDKFQRPIANLQLLDSYGMHMVNYSDWFITDGVTKIIANDGTNTIRPINSITGNTGTPIMLASSIVQLDMQSMAFTGGILRIASLFFDIYTNTNIAKVESFNITTGALLQTVQWSQVNLANGNIIQGFTSDGINDYMLIGNWRGAPSTLYTATTPSIVAITTTATAITIAPIAKLIGAGMGVIYAVPIWGMALNEIWRVDIATAAITTASWNPLAGGSSISDVSILGSNAYVYNGGGTLHTYSAATLIFR